MSLLRRSLLLTVPGLALAPALLPTGARAEDDPRLAPRGVGSPSAPVAVNEYFSLTCPHCARFARDTLPEIHKDLIDTGKLHYVYQDFPLDQVALTAAMVARALPPDRYEPFVLALLASQDRWAFARGVNSTEEIFKMAALAGMSRVTFDATIADTKLRDAILAGQDHASKDLHVDSTPTFIFDGPTQKDRHASGELSYDAFAQVVKEVGGTT
jgi:protein-disulfide isomerase